jgi:hypothetical protein
MALAPSESHKDYGPGRSVAALQSAAMPGYFQEFNFSSAPLQAQRPLRIRRGTLFYDNFASRLENCADVSIGRGRVRQENCPHHYMRFICRTRLTNAIFSNSQTACDFCAACSLAINAPRASIAKPQAAKHARREERGQEIDPDPVFTLRSLFIGRGAV